MLDFVKVRIVKCSKGQPYEELIGHHGWATSVVDSSFYRIRNEKYPYIKKEDTEPCNELGRNF
jgi:hypothetical protein